MARPADFDFYRSILEDLHLAVFLVDRGGKIVFWNDGAERITGYLRQEVIGRMDNDNLLGEADGNDNDLSGPCAPTSVAMREGKPIRAHRISLRHKSGHRVPVELWSFPVRNAEGTIVGAAETFDESVSISDWDRRQTKLATYGCIDQASGVLNHGMIHSHVRENLGLFAEHHVPFSILCIQLDHLRRASGSRRTWRHRRGSACRGTDSREQPPAHGFSRSLAGKSVPRHPHRVQRHRDHLRLRTPAPDGLRIKDRLVGRSLGRDYLGGRHRREARRHGGRHGIARRTSATAKHRERRKSYYGAARLTP